MSSSVRWRGFSTASAVSRANWSFRRQSSMPLSLTNTRQIIFSLCFLSVHTRWLCAVFVFYGGKYSKLFFLLKHFPKWYIKHSAIYNTCLSNLCAKSEWVILELYTLMSAGDAGAVCALERGHRRVATEVCCLHWQQHAQDTAHSFCWSGTGGKWSVLDSSTGIYVVDVCLQRVVPIFILLGFYYQQH